MPRVKRLKTWIMLVLVSTVMLLAVAFAFNANMTYAQAASVSSEQIETERVPIENVQLIANANEQVNPSQEITLKLVLTPTYAIETAKSVEYLVLSGFSYIARSDNVLRVKDNAEIGGVFAVKARVDGLESKTLTFTIVETPVEKINILNTETKVQQNRTLKIATEVLPDAATNKSVYYTLTSGKSYASIGQNGILTVNNSLPSGDLTVTVRVESIADKNVFAEKTFDLYVPTRSLYVAASNLNPVLGESITLYALISETASANDAKFSVREEDKRYVKSLEGDVLTIAENITDFNPSITVYYSRDGITAEKKISIIVPVTGLEFVSHATTIKQGGMMQFSVLPSPANGTLNNLVFSLADYDNASITVDGLLSVAIYPDRDNQTVVVIAEVNGVRTDTTITILRPDVYLTANNYTPTTSSKAAQTISLSTTVDGLMQTDDLTYNIKRGDNYIQGGQIIDGSFTIAKGIVDCVPEIVVSVTYGSWESNEIVIRPVVLVEEIRVKNSSVTLVEQQRQYDFSGVCYPINATKAGNALSYSLNVPPSIATISYNGELSVLATAPIDQVIVITINGSDGISTTHTVTVKKVYATELRLDKVTNQYGSDILNYGTVNPGDVLTFDAVFPSPFNVTDAVKMYSVEFGGGNNIATYSGHTATIILQSAIAGYNPYITFKVVSMQNGEALMQYFTVYVHISVTHIEYTQLKTQVGEGEFIPISSLVSATAKPGNSNVQDIEYSVSGYATLMDNYVKVDGDLASGGLKFTLYLIAENVIVPLDFNIYTATKDIDLTADNYNPLTQSSSGETVTITVTKDTAATSEMVVKMNKGEGLITQSYTNGSVIPLSYDANGVATFAITIKTSTNISADKLVQFEAVQGELNKSIDILIYKPIEQFTVTTAKVSGSTLYINRGTPNMLTVSFTANASESNKWTVDIAEVNISNRSTPIITIPQSATFGKTYIATFKMNDRLNKAFTYTFTVNKLDEELFRFKDGSVNPYTVDSEGFEIKSEKPQLWEGRHANIKITYNGLDLKLYGLDIKNFDSTNLGFVNGSDYATMSRLSYNEVQLKINDGTSGKVSVQPEITVQDGNISYSITLKSIAVFKRMSGTPTITNGTIVTTPAKLLLGNGTFDTNATYGLSALVFWAETMSGAAITEAGSLNISSDTAGGTQYIRLRSKYKNGDFTQFYNGEGVEYTSDIIPQSIRIITFNQQGGSTDGSTANYTRAGVTDRLRTITKPIRAGYIFGGYYTSTGGGGTQYYDANGELKVTHSNYTSNTTLYAKWTGITYYATFYYKDDVGGLNPVSFKDGSKGSTKIAVTYGTAFTIKDYDISGGDSTFVAWKVDGVTVSNSKRSVPPTYTTEPNKVIQYVGWCTWSNENCIDGDTLVTLADRSQKAVRDLTTRDDLLVWNLLTGTYDTAPIFFNASHAEQEYSIIKLLLSDGSSVEVIGSHGFWSYTACKFIYIDESNADSFIGHYFAKETTNGLEKVKLVDVLRYEKTTTAYSPHAYAHFAFFANGVLNVPNQTDFLVNLFEFDTDTVMYDEAKFEQDIATFGLLKPEDLGDLVPEYFFYGFNAQWLSVAIGKGIITMEGLYEFVNGSSEYVIGGDL